MKKLISLIALTAMATSMLVSGANASSTNPTSPQPFSCATLSSAPAVAKPFSSISLPCIGTTTKISLAQIKGPALINVWGSWCFPCRQELPLLRQAFLTHRLPMIGIDVEESSASRGIAFAASQKVTWLNLYDPDSRTKTVFGFGVPVSWYINAAGKIVYKHIGVYAKYGDVQSDVKKYLGITL